MATDPLNISQAPEVSDGTHSSASPSDRTNQKIEALKAADLQYQLRTLKKTQKHLFTAYAEHQSVLNNLMQATNGMIYGSLQIAPTEINQAVLDVFRLNMRPTEIPEAERTWQALRWVMSRIYTALDELRLKEETLLAEKETDSDSSGGVSLGTELGTAVTDGPDNESSVESKLLEMETKYLQLRLVQEMRNYYNEVIYKNQQFVINVLRRLFDCNCSALREIVVAEIRYTFDKESYMQRPIRLPRALQRDVESVPEQFALLNPQLAINELASAASSIHALHSEAVNIAVDFHNRTIAASRTAGAPAPLSSIESIREKIRKLEMPLPAIEIFKVQLDYGYSEIERYQDQIEKMDKMEKMKKIETKASSIQTRDEMIKESEAARENVLLRMVEIKRSQCECIGCNCVSRERSENSVEPGVGTKNRNEHDRKLMEDLFNDKDAFGLEDLFAVRISSSITCYEEQQ